MSVINEACGFCGGHGKAQKLEERGQDGWYPNRTLDHALADAWIASDCNAPLRWIDCSCPSCEGTGSVLVEYVQAKIF